MTCFLTSVRVLRMKTLVVVYDPPRTPPLGLLGPLAPFFLLQPLCGGDISTTVSASSTGIMLGRGASLSGGSQIRHDSILFFLHGSTKFLHKFVSP